MQDIEEKRVQDAVIKKTCLSSNTLYLATHIAYLIFFLFLHLYILVYINIGSVIFYLIQYFVIKNKKYGIYARLCGVEIVSYMFVATLLCGFKAGFHLCIIGLCIIAFYTSYFNKKRKAILPLGWSVMSLIIYLFLYFYCRFNETYYILDSWAEITLFVVHSLVVFSVITVYLNTFTSYALKLEEKIKKESRTDTLTKVYNRHALYDYLLTLENKDEYNLVILDIDDFKKINDTYGHICGDFILKEVARLSDNYSDDDFVSRYGGEEFVIILKSRGDFESSIKYVDGLRELIQNHEFIYDNKEIHLTITIGIAKYIKDISIDDWINTADMKLYEGKNSGKNKTVS